MQNVFMEFLAFTFQGFWHFIGVVILINCFFGGIAAVFNGLGALIHGPKASVIQVESDNG